jgi:hypothetical protein
MTLLASASLSKNVEPGEDFSGFIYEWHFEKLIEMFVLTRIRDVLLPKWEFLSQSRFSIALQGYSAAQMGYCLPIDLKTHYVELQNEMTPALTTEADKDIRDICTQAINSLELMNRDICYYSSCAEGDEKEVDPVAHWEMTVVTKWFAMVPAGFVSLVRTKFTAAMIVLAHVVILYKPLERVWLYVDWSRNALDAIRATVSPKASIWLQWPESRIC